MGVEGAAGVSSSTSAWPSWVSGILRKNGFINCGSLPNGMGFPLANPPKHTPLLGTILESPPICFPAARVGILRGPVPRVSGVRRGEGAQGLERRLLRGEPPMAGVLHVRWDEVEILKYF